MAFIIKAMVKNEKEKNLYNPCGCDYTRIIRDLKTFRGVKNRIKNWSWPDDTVELYVYSNVNVTNEKYDKFIATIKL